MGVATHAPNQVNFYIFLGVCSTFAIRKHCELSLLVGWFSFWRPKKGLWWTGPGVREAWQLIAWDVCRLNVRRPISTCTDWCSQVISGPASLTANNVSSGGQLDDGCFGVGHALTPAKNRKIKMLGGRIILWLYASSLPSQPFSQPRNFERPTHSHSDCQRRQQSERCPLWELIEGWA